MRLLNTYKNTKVKHLPIYIPTGSKPYLTRYALMYTSHTKRLMCSFLANGELLLRISLPENNLVKLTKISIILNSVKEETLS